MLATRGQQRGGAARGGQWHSGIGPQEQEIGVEGSATLETDRETRFKMPWAQTVNIYIIWTFRVSSVSPWHNCQRHGNPRSPPWFWGRRRRPPPTSWSPEPWCSWCLSPPERKKDGGRYRQLEDHLHHVVASGITLETPRATVLRETVLAKKQMQNAALCRPTLGRYEKKSTCL